MSGLDEAADGGHLDVVDDTFDRRAEFALVELAARAAERLFVDRDLLVDLAAFVERVLAEAEARFIGLAERLADRGVGAPALFARGGDPALEVDHFATRVEQFGLRNDILGGKRLEHRNLLLREAEAARQAVDGGVGFGAFAAALLGRRLERGDPARQRFAAGIAEQGFVAADRIACPGALGLKPRRAFAERLGFGLDLTEFGR